MRVVFNPLLAYMLARLVASIDLPHPTLVFRMVIRFTLQLLFGTTCIKSHKIAKIGFKNRNELLRSKYK